MMKRADVFKNYLAALEDASSEEGIAEILGEIESLLCDPELTRARVMYLESLGEAGSDTKGVPVSISTRQYRHMIEDGLVEAYKSEIVEPEKLAKLVHSVDAIQRFTDTLSEIPFDRHAECWKSALDFDDDYGEITIPEVKRSRHSDSIWIAMSESIAGWMDAVAPPPPKAVLGFRGKKSAPGINRVNLNGAVARHDAVRTQIESLKSLLPSVDDRNISDSSNKIRWDELASALEKAGSWDRYLREAGRILNENLTRSEIHSLQRWVHDREGKYPHHADAIKLLSILLLSTEIKTEKE